MTFSLVARCAETGMFGVAISSSSPAVAARCGYAEAGIGAVSTQNVTDPRLGPAVLGAMRTGQSAENAVASIAGGSEHPAFRQVLAVDPSGGTGIHSGQNALGIWADAKGPDVASGGNLLADPGVPDAIVAAFTGSDGHLGDRLIDAMRAGLLAGGEAGPVHSGGLLLVREVPWPVADLRVDWTDGCPIAELAALWDRYKPQMDDYVTRALNPAAAPSYGVPGDA